MTKKRKIDDFQTEDAIYNKRSRNSQADGNDDAPGAQSKIDPTYGQRSAFPGLDGPCDDDGLFYGPASDGLEYLRMVRSEAKTVPNLLVAPSSSGTRTQDEDIYKDYAQGFYADGAYTATPLPPSDFPYTRPGQQEDEDLDPQEAYYTSLCARFAKISQILQTQPPPAPTETTKPPLPHWTIRQWRNRILTTTPTMALLAQVPQEMVIHGLKNLESTLTSNNMRTGKGKNIGAWVWGLLARCRDVGQMASEEVGVLRDLGKMAVWLLRRIAAGEVVGDVAKEAENMTGEGKSEEACGGEVKENEDGEGDEDDGIVGGGSDEMNGLEQVSAKVEDEGMLLAEARDRVLSTLPPSSQAEDDPKSQMPSRSDDAGFVGELETPRHTETEIVANQEIESTRSAFDQMAMRATLDMLVTIIGECYGQRDLLDGRLLWDEIDGFR